MAHVVDTAIPDGVNVDKSATRSMLKNNLRFRVASADTVRTGNYADYPFIEIPGAFYDRDNSDTTTADTGGSVPAVLVDSTGKRFKYSSSSPLSGNFRTILTANRTYYVRKDGSDSNDGRSDTAGGAFLTIQKALNVVFGELDLSIYNVTIQVRSTGSPTTYAENLTVSNPRLGRGSVTLLGDQVTPGNISIAGSSHCLNQAGLSELTIRGFRLRPGGNNNSIYHTGYATTFYGEIEFAGSVSGGGSHLNCLGGGLIQSVAACTISGGGASHISAARKSAIVAAHLMTVTGTPAFSTAFALSTQNSFVLGAGAGFSGAATGTRYSATLNGVIDTLGGGASYFPGNVAGSTATGGQYA